MWKHVERMEENRIPNFKSLIYALNIMLKASK